MEWTEEECIAAVYMYSLKTKRNSSYPSAPEALKVREMLASRSDGAINFIIGNICSLDTDYGGKGLANASPTLRKVWDRFAADGELDKERLESDFHNTSIYKSSADQ